MGRDFEGPWSKGRRFVQQYGSEFGVSMPALLVLTTIAKVLKGALGSKRRLTRCRAARVFVLSVEITGLSTQTIQTDWSPLEQPEKLFSRVMRRQRGISTTRRRPRTLSWTDQLGQAGATHLLAAVTYDWGTWADTRTTAALHCTGVQIPRSKSVQICIWTCLSLTVSDPWTAGRAHGHRKPSSDPPSHRFRGYRRSCQTIQCSGSALTDRILPDGTGVAE